MNLTVDGSIDQERILVSEWIMPSLSLPLECTRTGSTGWLSVCGTGHFKTWLLKSLIGSHRSLSLCAPSLVWSSTLKWQKSHNSKVKHHQSVTDGRKPWLSWNKGLCTGIIYDPSSAPWYPREEERSSGMRHNPTLSHWERASSHVWRCNLKNAPSHYFLICIYHLPQFSYVHLFSVTHTKKNVCFRAINAGTLFPFVAMHFVYEYLKVSGGIFAADPHYSF